MVKYVSPVWLNDKMRSRGRGDFVLFDKSVLSLVTVPSKFSFKIGNILFYIFRR